jgi:hypothetical protein
MVGLEVFSKLQQAGNDLIEIHQKNHQGLIDDAHLMMVELKKRLKYEHTEALKFIKSNAKMVKDPEGRSILEIMAVLAATCHRVNGRLEKKDGIKQAQNEVADALAMFAPETQGS